MIGIKIVNIFRLKDRAENKEKRIKFLQLKFKIDLRKKNNVIVKIERNKVSS